MFWGRNMEDILFNNSQNHPVSALAEVILTLALDSDPSSAESSVARRLYRGGDSEHLFNKVSCRLKDVINSFIDQRGWALGLTV